VSGVARRATFLALAVSIGLVVCACSDAVVGRGTLVPGAARATVTPGPGAASTATPTAKPTSTRPRDPAAVARAVNIRPGDLPAGWQEIRNSRGGRDSLSWVVVCARDAGVSPGTLSGAETPDFSPRGNISASQVGTATGLFPDDTAAARYVALLRNSSVGRCMAAEAQRVWADSFSGTVPAFRPTRLPVGAATEGAGMATGATLSTGQRTTIQFFAIRTGPIVTMLDTVWYGDAKPGLLAAVAARIGTRQQSA
jgi:hypothetical protein